MDVDVQQASPLKLPNLSFDSFPSHGTSPLRCPPASGPPVSALSPEGGYSPEGGIFHIPLPPMMSLHQCSPGCVLQVRSSSTHSSRQFQQQQRSLTRRSHSARSQLFPATTPSPTKVSSADRKRPHGQDTLPSASLAGDDVAPIFCFSADRAADSALMQQLTRVSFSRYRERLSQIPKPQKLSPALNKAGKPGLSPRKPRATPPSTRRRIPEQPLSHTPQATPPALGSSSGETGVLTSGSGTSSRTAGWSRIPRFGQVGATLSPHELTDAGKCDVREWHLHPHPDESRCLRASLDAAATDEPNHASVRASYEDKVCLGTPQLLRTSPRPARSPPGDGSETMDTGAEEDLRTGLQPGPQDSQHHHTDQAQQHVPVLASSSRMDLFSEVCSPQLTVPTPSRSPMSTPGKASGRGVQLEEQLTQAEAEISRLQQELVTAVGDLERMRNSAEGVRGELRSRERMAKGAVLSAIEGQFLAMRSACQAESVITSTTMTTQEVRSGSPGGGEGTEGRGKLRRLVGRSISFGRQGHQVAAAAAVHSSFAANEQWVGSGTTAPWVGSGTTAPRVGSSTTAPRVGSGTTAPLVKLELAISDPDLSAEMAVMRLRCEEQEITIRKLQNQVVTALATRELLRDQLLHILGILKSCTPALTHHNQQPFHFSMPWPTHQDHAPASTCLGAARMLLRDTQLGGNIVEAVDAQHQGTDTARVKSLQGKEAGISRQQARGRGEPPEVDAKRLEQAMDCLWFGATLSLAD